LGETSEPKVAFEKEEYRLRLRVLRKFFERNGPQFAEMIGIPYKQWHHYERGYPIARETAFLMMEQGIPVDWLWFGDAGRTEREWTRGQLVELLRQQKKASQKASKRHPARARIKEPKVKRLMKRRSR
jgi:hypothetical protein